MSIKFDTIIGKIYCSYDKDTDSFNKIRVVDIKNDNFMVAHLDENNHINKDIPMELLSTEEFAEAKKDCVLLRSDGIASISNVVSVSNPSTEIKDVLVIYFPNNKITNVPDCHQPFIVARQGITNLFAAMANEDTVGMAVSINSLPAGYALSDFMENERVISSNMTHVYKTDTAEDISILLDNETSDDILDDLYKHAIYHNKNIIDGYKHEEVEDDCVDGYCNSIRRFLCESDFMGEFYNYLGIIKVDFPLEDNKAIVGEDKLVLTTLAGGIKVDKAVPLAFDYDINMNAIKMKYFLVIDSNNKLWIVPYTVSSNEIDADSVYKLTEEATSSLQERLKKIVMTYDKSKNIESKTVKEMKLEN